MNRTPNLQPFTKETAQLIIEFVENVWNNKDPFEISNAYAINSKWYKNEVLLVNGHQEIQKLLSDKWEKELDYKLENKYRVHTDNSILVQVKCEYRHQCGQWYRAKGIETWEFDKHGCIQKRFIRTNVLAIKEEERLLHENVNDFLNLSKLLQIE